jgi:hypothetical protein
LLRRLQNLLVVLLLTARSLLPVGLMLAVPQAGDGLMTVVICTAHGSETITLDSEGRPAPSKAPSGDIVPCPCTLMGAVALCPDAPSRLDATAYSTRVIYAAVEGPPTASTRLGGHSARGPPPALI